MKVYRILLSLTLLLTITLLSNGQNQTIRKDMTAGQIIAAIISNTGSKVIPNTVDVIKEGDPQTEVTGIVTCMFATMEVLKEAVNKNCNLLIVHEPLYYNHLDETDRFKNDPVFLEKKKYINDHKLVIWRFHDYIHSMIPDGIESGMVKKLGWENYAVNGSTNRFTLPEITLKDLAKSLKTVFPKNAFYVIGDPELKIKNIRYAAGAPGSAMHINLLEDNNVDAVIAGEAQQWETYEYTRDAVDQGKKKAIIFLGHINSEESGMDYCAGWLNGFTKDMPVYFVPCGPSFWSY